MRDIVRPEVGPQPSRSVNQYSLGKYQVLRSPQDMMVHIFDTETKSVVKIDEFDFRRSDEYRVLRNQIDEINRRNQPLHCPYVPLTKEPVSKELPQEPLPETPLVMSTPSQTLIIELAALKEKYGKDADVVNLVDMCAKVVVKHERDASKPKVKTTVYLYRYNDKTHEVPVPEGWKNAFSKLYEHISVGETYLDWDLKYDCWGTTPIKCEDREATERKLYKHPIFGICRPCIERLRY